MYKKLSWHLQLHILPCAFKILNIRTFKQMFSALMIPICHQICAYIQISIQMFNGDPICTSWLRIVILSSLKISRKQITGMNLIESTDYWLMSSSGRRLVSSMLNFTSTCNARHIKLISLVFATQDGAHVLNFFFILWSLWDKLKDKYSLDCNMHL